MAYKGHSFVGLQAMCLQRQERRTFNVDRILEVRPNRASEKPMKISRESSALR